MAYNLPLILSFLIRFAISHSSNYSFIFTKLVGFVFTNNRLSQIFKIAISGLEPGISWLIFLYFDQ